jgi:hypothetical protein
MRFVLALLLLPLAACTGDDSAWWAHPPEGTRWVGYDAVAVAVPDWWTTGETQCGAPVEDTVYFDSGAIVDCSAPRYDAAADEVSSLAVLRDNGRYGEDELDGSCQAWFPGVCRRLFAVADSDVIFAVTIDEHGDGDFEEIRASARELPDGVTTVPLEVDGWTPSWGEDPAVARALVDAIEAAGLEVEVEVADPDRNGDVADLPRGALLDVEPALGTPIEVGDRVKVTVMGTSGP